MDSSKHPEAAFLAAMTASATHEVRNVLAIIKESAGLVGDLVQVYGARANLDEEKISRAVERIEIQVKRGADLLTNLNRLAHTLDQDLSTVELNQEVEQLVFLSQRFARQKGQQVEAEGGREERPLVVNPLLLHMALHRTMMWCLEELPQGSKVTVITHEEDGATVAEFQGDDGGKSPLSTPGGDDWQDLQHVANAAGAEIERSPKGYGVRILFPKNPGARGPLTGSGGQKTA